MNNKILIALGALVVVAGLAIWQVNQRGDDSDAMAARKDAASTLEELDDKAIEELEVHVPGEAPVIVTKKGDSWRITAPYDAQPDVSTVQSALEKLADMTVRRVAASNPENHATLEVDEKAGIRVIARGGGKTLRDVVIGSFGGGEQMVRLHGEDPVFAVDQSLRWVFNKKLKDWRDKTITEETAANVVKIDFEQPDARWTFVKDGDTWKQVEPKKPIEKFDSAKVDSMASTLSRLSAVDFGEPSMTPEQAGLGEGAAKVTLTYSVPAGADAGAGASDAGTAKAAPDKELVLLVGKEKDGNTYVKRQDGKLIYLVSGYTAKKLKPTLEEFQESEEPEAHPGMAGMPGMPGMQGGPGGQNIPPDVMAKIQAQLQAQGQQ